MKCRDWLIEQLVLNGLWPEEALSVVDLVASQPSMTALHWHDDITAYPPSMKAGLWLLAKDEAVRWIDATQPNHFARQMFAD